MINGIPSKSACALVHFSTRPRDEALQTSASSPHSPSAGRYPSLNDAAVFRGMDASVIADLTEQLRPVRFRPGQLVFAIGEPGDRLYMILEGKVKIGNRADDGRKGPVADRRTNRDVRSPIGIRPRPA